MPTEIKAPVVTIPRDKAIRLIIIAAMGGFLLGSLVVTSKSLKKDTGGKSRHANFLDTEDAKFATEATRPKPWDEPTSSTVVEPQIDHTPGQTFVITKDPNEIDPLPIDEWTKRHGHVYFDVEATNRCPICQDHGPGIAIHTPEEPPTPVQHFTVPADPEPEVEGDGSVTA